MSEPGMNLHVPPDSGPPASPEPPPRSPWITIWLQSRPTLRHILATDPNRAVFSIAALAGVVQALSIARVLAEVLQRPLDPSLGAISVLVGGPVAGIAALHLRTAMLWLTSSWLGGRAGWRQIRAAVAWAMVPLAALMAAWIPAILAVRSGLFEPGLAERVLESGGAMLLPWMGLDLLQLVCSVWSFVLLIRCVGEVEGFSAWRAVAAISLAGLVEVATVAAAVLAALWIAVPA